MRVKLVQAVDAFIGLVRLHPRLNEGQDTRGEQRLAHGVALLAYGLPVKDCDLL